MLTARRHPGYLKMKTPKKSPDNMDDWNWNFNEADMQLLNDQMAMIESSMSSSHGKENHVPAVEKYQATGEASLLRARVEKLEAQLSAANLSLSQQS